MANMWILSARIQVPVSLNNNRVTTLCSTNPEIPKGPKFSQRKMETPLEFMKKLAAVRKLQEKRFYENPQVKENVIRSVPAQVANEFFKAGCKYLDVRTKEEFNNEHVEGSINIPYIEKWSSTSGDSDFLEQVEARFGKRDEIIVGYTLGKFKSFGAANELVNAGYTNVTILRGGYEAWKKSGLPIVTNGKGIVRTDTNEEIKNEEE